MLSYKEKDLLEYKIQSRISLSMIKGIEGILIASIHFVIQ